MSGVSIIMAGALQRDLIARGVRHIDFGDCEAIVARVLDCARTIECATRDDDAPPRRCETGEIDLDLTCMACGAIEGETCRQLIARHQPEGER
ncbi:hypothetical protein ACMA5K_24335 [Bradyrhizobium diazoefficiens]|uniref:hypothetical protein n=1 Tax=Bradyrhizobium diazoefficiens TaxID=1355477 RepID=UPI000BE844CD|nr:hypothetical protein [Bradyrhizobium diazoefficiens]PDT58684.1 hypothetical protein CO678_25985 [Bradyrhizobium diazoefficiens]QLD43871.1 hypothetical protein HUW42_24120 [Bradyrhizobium diazoefficiens]